MKAVTLDENNIVINVSGWTEDSIILDGQIVDLVDDSIVVGPGWRKDGNSYIQPEPPPKEKEPVFKITRRQCAIELRERNLITPQEALDMTRTGIPPAMVQTIFNSMPTTDRILAETDFAADTYMRSNPLLVSIMTASGASEQDIDQFFISAAEK